jgi:cytidine deaminase
MFVNTISSVAGVRALAAPRFGFTLVPEFITPMVVNHVPAFDIDNPQVVRFYTDLMEHAKKFSKPDVSGRRIGMVAIGESGRAYLGTNVEFKASEASWTIHGEVFAIALARKYGERKITRLVMSLQPCDPCRQIIRETGYDNIPLTFITENAASKTIAATYREATNGSLSPEVYSYATPRLNLFRHPNQGLEKRFCLSPRTTPLERQAFYSANQSYSPNKRETWAGLAVKLRDHSIYTGNAITISGPNPTIVPMMALITKLIADGRSPAEIEQAVLVEPPKPDYSFKASTAGILKIVAPNAKLKILGLQPLLTAP